MQTGSLAVQQNITMGKTCYSSKDEHSVLVISRYSSSCISKTDEHRIFSSSSVRHLVEERGQGKKVRPISGKCANYSSVQQWCVGHLRHTTCWPLLLWSSRRPDCSISVSWGLKKSLQWPADYQNENYRCNYGFTLGTILKCLYQQNHVWLWIM